MHSPIFERVFGGLLNFCSWQHAHLVVTTSLSLKKMSPAMWLSFSVCSRSVLAVWNCSSFLIARRAQEIWMLSVFGCHFLTFGCPRIHLSVEMISPELALAVILWQVLCSHCAAYGWKIILFMPRCIFQPFAPRFWISRRYRDGVGFFVCLFVFKILFDAGKMYLFS